jgi:hypothetical protein
MPVEGVGRMKVTNLSRSRGGDLSGVESKGGEMNVREKQTTPN